MHLKFIQTHKTAVEYFEPYNEICFERSTECARYVFFFLFVYYWVFIRVTVVFYAIENAKLPFIMLFCRRVCLADENFSKPSK